MSDDYRRRMDELEAERDFAERERKKREQKRLEEERIRREATLKENRLRAEYERLKRSGMILPPYEQWKRNLI